jgi:hypothetical protein
VGSIFDYLRKQEDFNNIPDCYPFHKKKRNKKEKSFCLISYRTTLAPDGQTEEQTLTVDGVPSRITGQLFKNLFSWKGGGGNMTIFLP